MEVFAITRLSTYGSLSNYQTVVWNSSLPLPPIQPPELIYEEREIDKYSFIVTNETILDLEVSSTVYSSYERLYQTSISGGSNYINSSFLVASQICYNNYTDPSNPLASLIADYGSGFCEYFAVEGGAAFPGYDYYTNFVLFYSNVPRTKIYYTVGNGIVSYSGSIPGGTTVYTIIFNSTTNLLIEYSAIGTETCCPLMGPHYAFGNCIATGLPPEPCRDSSIVTYSKYRIVNSSTWEDSFIFTPRCPYDIVYYLDGDEPSVAPSMSPTVLTTSPSISLTSQPSFQVIPSKQPTQIDNLESKSGSATNSNTSTVSFIFLYTLIPSFFIWLGTIYYFCTYWKPKNGSSSNDNKSESIREPFIRSVV